MATLTFWLDVDNTLLNNDFIKADLDEHVRAAIGEKLTERYWQIYEDVRKEKDVVDIPLALSRLRAEVPLSELDQHTYEHVRSLFDNYPFQKALYPYALETLEYLRTLGLTVIVSDGDPYFQAEKIVESALAQVVDGRVLLYIHKQDHVHEIMKAYPADHYVLIDDKPQIHIDIKRLLGDLVTTVLVRQGKYAAGLPEDFTPDITVDHIGDLRGFTAEQFLRARKD